MGACLSSESTCNNSAFVISVKGQLTQYPTPVFVSEVLHHHHIHNQKPTSTSSSFFLCNSDKLYYDHYISALDSEEELDAGHIYFILPNTMLHTRLTASQMASLAVKASVALHQYSNSCSNSINSKKIMNRRVSPMVLMDKKVVADENEDEERVCRRRRKSLKKQRRKKGVGVGSFRLQLSTIYENQLMS